MAGHPAVISGYWSLPERADRFRRIQLEYVYHFIPATRYEPRIVDPCDIQTAGYDDGQRVPSIATEGVLLPLSAGYCFSSVLVAMFHT